MQMIFLISKIVSMVKNYLINADYFFDKQKPTLKAWGYVKKPNFLFFVACYCSRIRSDKISKQNYLLVQLINILFCVW